MNITIFNCSMLAGWLLFLVGSVAYSPALGLAAAGVLLVLLVLVAAHLAGGLYVPAARRGGEGEGEGG